jgi:hypothetical protein
MQIRSIILLCAFVSTTAAAAVGCGGDNGDGGGTYCCRYESRHTPCGGGTYSNWQAEKYEFNIDDYVAGWTPEAVCNKFTGNWTNCEAGCCINGQYRNNTLSSGKCG